MMKPTYENTGAGDRRLAVRRFVEDELEALAGIRGGVAPGDKSGRTVDRGALACLRQTAGNGPNQSIEAFKFLADWTCDLTSEWEVRCHFLVAALFAFYQQGGSRPSWHHDTSIAWNHRNLGASFRMLELAMQRRNNEGEPNFERSKAVEKRFTILLSSRQEDLPERLRHSVLLLRSFDVPIDWVQLLEDLRWWRRGERAFRSDNSRKSTQRQWAESFWRICNDAVDGQPELMEAQEKFDS